MDIDSNFPYLLFGETTSHLTSTVYLRVLVDLMYKSNSILS